MPTRAVTGPIEDWPRPLEPPLRNGPVVVIALAVLMAFAAVAAQTVRLALTGNDYGPRAQVAEPLVRSFARPDIVDRRGRLLATDLITHSLFADPTQVVDVDETSERLSAVLTGLDRSELRATLADRSRRFVWIKRHLGPADAQRIHDLGLAGLLFRAEPRRVYPQGRMAGHIIGHVNVDNRGISGLERFIDEKQGLESGYSAEFSRLPVPLTLDVGAQHALEDELKKTSEQFRAKGAAGVILNAMTGAVLAAATLPGIDPARPADSLLPANIDRLGASAWELGSIMQVFTVAMALETGLATPSTVIDVRVPLQIGSWTIKDLAPSGRPLAVREILIQSSNIGVAHLALRAGADRQRRFLRQLGLLEPVQTEPGSLGRPRAPDRWGEIETATVAYGHGIALSPLQVAGAVAAIVNGGTSVRPHFVDNPASSADKPAPERVISAQTSTAMRDMLRRAVTQTNGTGRRADVPGLEIGGKTGTAEQSGPGGYQARNVISSFVGAFPISSPRYVVLVSVFEPQPAADDSAGKITAGVTAAPLAARVIARTASILGVAPR